ncbi:hypothetical protein EVAR_71088_1 [Eumeta japonica]|uniref:Uncharacterized protein n=1 Tax=Eumeta variegata TaxID=151549 RepID=A0A4C1S8R4_EUMVA|nr:hypothetical protein EVAR_71088_1 [Eumeta japonica]
MKLVEQRLRKRSRDGLLIGEERLTAAQTLSRSPSPPAQDKYSESTVPPMVVLPASTIVRNPFASPNPSNQAVTTNASTTSAILSSSSSSASGSATSASSTSSNSAAISYRARDRSISPSLLTAHARNDSHSLASPTNGSTPQISIHPHPAATVAAAAALANPNHPSSCSCVATICRPAVAACIPMPPWPGASLAAAALPQGQPAVAVLHHITTTWKSSLK